MDMSWIQIGRKVKNIFDTMLESFFLFFKKRQYSIESTEKSKPYKIMFCISLKIHFSSKYKMGLFYPFTFTFPAKSSIKANSIAVSFNASNRPDAPPCPASILVWSNNGLLSVFKSRNLATHLAGSQY